ncbi:NAD(P)/FAD-dependent oxidoreductase [Pararhizobium sp.]|uniref:NAD(P)/FAD-dependent oxidoreductase n=1 Tax=Pararhizobium sp. TaxID=1977563 RepID=UPI002722C91F|nr:FAD-dependent oxidoreductase [Pararhizobium sp.]MDO9417816.1 FAD-dependent oxidoreductase [Pararhizobium sp.]
MADCSFQSVWDFPERSTLPDSPLEGGKTVDLAIVGGGIMGLSTALAAARNGMRVRVLEARTLGEGASGLNGGQVIPGLKYDPDWLIANFGAGRGEALVDFASKTADAVFDLIRTEKLDVPHVRNGWIQAAHTQTALDAALARDRQWRARGADIAMLDAGEIARLTGAQGYLGGWLDRRAGAIDPLRYTLELARLAREAGVGVATHTAVTGVKKSGNDWCVSTASGPEIRARFVVIATNAYSDGLIPGLAQTLVPLHSFQIATAPLPDALTATILPQGQAVSDSRRILVYYRKSPDGRLMVGGRGRMAVPRHEGDWRHLHRAMLRLYPQLGGIEIEKRWFGRVAMTRDYLPHIHEPEPGLLVAAGCQGRGLGLMTALGPCFANYLASGDPGMLPLPISPIRPIAFHAFRQIGVAATITWYRMLDAMQR